MSSYALRDRVGCCRSGDRIVFLDVTADRYFCLGRKLEQAFAALLDNETVDAPAIAALRDAGVIVSAAAGRLALCTRVPARDALSGHLAARCSTICASILHRALWAVRVKTRTLSANLDRLVKPRMSPRTAPVDHAAVAALVAAYERARLWWSEQGHCLSTSLALMDDLIRMGCTPSMVFAVRLGPFEAHCWIELDGLLVNETPERVRAFTPILVIE